MNYKIIEKISEELFLLILKIKNKSIYCSSKCLLRIDASLKLIQYLENKMQNIQCKMPKQLEFTEKIENVLNNDTQNKIFSIYSRLLRITNLYENTGN